MDNSHDDFIQWHKQLPPFSSERIIAIIRRYTPMSPHGVAEAAIQGLCPGKPVAGMLDTLHSLKRLRYITGRSEGYYHLCFGMRYWSLREDNDDTTP